MIVFLLSNKNVDVLHLSGDDLHKWERDDDNWKKFTHLNPKANNLDIGNIQLMNLVRGSKIKRNIYNHDTGKFIRNVTIEPADVIVNEGLHTLYDSDVCNASDLNIFGK